MNILIALFKLLLGSILHAIFGADPELNEKSEHFNLTKKIVYVSWVGLFISNIFFMNRYINMSYIIDYKLSSECLAEYYLVTNKKVPESLLRLERPIHIHTLLPGTRIAVRYGLSTEYAPYDEYTFYILSRNAFEEKDREFSLKGIDVIEKNFPHPLPSQLIEKDTKEK